MARHDRVPEDPARVNARPRGCLILGLIGLTVLVFFAVVYAVYAIRTTADEPVLVTGVEIEKIQPPGFYSLSAQQQDVLSQNGYPDSFPILFYDKTMPNGQRARSVKSPGITIKAGLGLFIAMVKNIPKPNSRQKPAICCAPSTVLKCSSGR